MNPPLNPPFRAALAALMLVFAAACSETEPAFKTTDVSQVSWGGDFALTAHTGKRVSTEEFRGKVILVFFGYTHCPDICAPTLTKLAAVRKSLGTDGKEVQVLFVTVDPKNDTAAQLAGFVPKFDPGFVGLTGKPQEIAAVAADHKVAFQPAPPAHAAHAEHARHVTAATIAHSGGVFVKDRKGKLRLYMAEGTPVADMAHDIRRLLVER